MKNKSRKQKMSEYENKYSEIPKNYIQRLEWMYDKYNVTPKMAESIIQKRDAMLSQLYYTTILIVLYEEPEGAKRPRFRIINRANVLNAAMANNEFVHVYSPDAAQNNAYMKQLVDSNEISSLSQLICTPCDVIYRAYFKTPSYYSKEDLFLAEIGLVNPATSKPDYDNIAKLYSDMYNSTVWIDDVLTIHGEVYKYYSILPRVEIELKYLNMVYNKYQYKQIINRKEFTNDINLTYFGGK